MKKLNIIITAAVCSFAICHAQNNALVLDGAFIAMNGGTVTTPIYLVVAQTNTLGITRSSNGGHIISESDYNFVKWNIGAAANGSYVFPFGVGAVAADYIPFTYDKISGDPNLAMSTYSTGIANTPLANTVTDMQPSGASSDALNMVVDRWWRLQMENGTTVHPADLSFSYLGSENTLTGINCPTDILNAQYWNGTTWVTPVLSPGTTCTTTIGVGTVSASGGTAFTATSSQPFVLTKAGSPLPVELLNFSAYCYNIKVILKWITASENNNDYFTLERDKRQGQQGQVEWEIIGTVKSQGGGNSSQPRYYSFIDTDPLHGTNYYRLKQTDYNAQYQYFKTVGANCTDAINLITIFPNPASNFIQYEISISDDAIVTAKVVDVLNQNVILQSYSLAEGISQKEMNVSFLSSGTYLLQVSTNGGLYKSQKQFVIK